MKRFGKKFGTTCFIIAALMLTFIQVAVLSAAQEKQEQQDVSKEEVEKYKEIKKA
ncbi:MAG: hypothetical protein JRJ74_15495, partial [Deltaproteobacteria bacterium]|nr:hypothetical protein [Deltaproteobacteria bacterium]